MELDKNLKSMLPEELSELLKSMNQPSYRAKQIFKWLHSGVRTWDEMTDVPKSLKSMMSESYSLGNPEIVKRQLSKDGTIKYLFELEDGNCVETVLMKYAHGNSVCVSTQAGCRMGCVFCASTIAGLVRNLTPGEIIGQIIAAQRDSGYKISNIVLMGTGEPLDNMENVMKFITLVNHPEGLNIGQRHISLSTSGLCEKIDILAELKLQITLSVSLHAPFDEIRNNIMPVNRAYGVEKLITTCERYFEKTGRRISYEYAMIKDVNDSEECAKKLASLLKGSGSHVNLIPLNSIEESPLKPSKPETVRRFQDTLTKAGITATVRRKLGSDIDASCGQLRRKYQKNKEERNG